LHDNRASSPSLAIGVNGYRALSLQLFQQPCDLAMDGARLADDQRVADG